jgi:hypothetical protein
LRSLYWKVLPHFVLGLLDLVNPFHLCRTIFSKMQRVERFHTAWAPTGGSRQRNMMPAIGVEADGRRPWPALGLTIAPAPLGRADEMIE